MADVKYSSTSSVAPIIGEPKLIDAESRATMYQKLQLSQDQIDFLDPVKGEKFMEYFEVGNERIIMYGNPMRMALESGLIKSMLDLDPPFQLASNITVLGGALMIVWLHLNGIPGSLGKMRNLSLQGYFGVEELINYLGVPYHIDEGRSLAMVWEEGFLNQVRKATSEELKVYAEKIANMINNSHRAAYISLGDTDVVEKLLGIDEIASRLNHIPVIIKHLSGTDLDYEIVNDLVGWIDVKKANDPEELMRILEPKGYDVNSIGFLTRSWRRFIPTRQKYIIIIYDDRILMKPRYGSEASSMIDKYKIVLPRSSGTKKKYPQSIM